MNIISLVECVISLSAVEEALARHLEQFLKVLIDVSGSSNACFLVRISTGSFVGSQNS